MENDKVTEAQQIERGELGHTGTYIIGGIISHEDYNRELTGFSGLRVMERMRRGDGTVRAALNAVKLPVLSAKWFIQPADDSDEAKRQAEFVQHNLFESINYNHFLRQALGCLDFGYSVFELVFDDIDWQGQQLLGLSNISHRKQNSILKWQTDTGEPGIVQLPLAGPRASIPAYKLLIFTNEKEGDNYEGISLLRNAYKHWYMKESLYKIDALAHEKQGLGIPVLRTPAGGGRPGDLAKARELVKNIRANEQSYFELPEGYEIEFLDMKANTTREPVNSMQHHDRQITKSVLAQFLEIGGEGSSGSYAASIDQVQLFIQSLESVADMVQATINEHAIKTLVAVNFGEQEEYPTLQHGQIGQENRKQLAESIKTLSDAKFITPDLDTEQYLRDLHNIPELPDELAENYNERVLERGAQSEQQSEGDAEGGAAALFAKEPKQGLLARARSVREALLDKIKSDE